MKSELIALPESFKEEMRKDEIRKEREIDNCHIEVKGKKVIVSIPAHNEQKAADLIFSTDNVKKFIQDIYVN